LIDNSGVRLYFTTDVRPIEVGITETEDPFVALRDTFINEEGLTQYQFECPGSCTQSNMDSLVTVIREFLHMHANGVAATNELIRDGDVVHRGEIQYFDFEQQGNMAVQQQPYQVQPGDGFRTSCTFQTTNETQFGLASQQEMCMAFIMYYPRVPSANGTFYPWTFAVDLPSEDFLGEGCEATGWNVTQVSWETMDRTFGASMSNCPAATSTDTSASPILITVWNTMVSLFLLYKFVQDTYCVICNFHEIHLAA